MQYEHYICSVGTDEYKFKVGSGVNSTLPTRVETEVTKIHLVVMAEKSETTSFKEQKSVFCGPPSIHH